MYLLLTVIALAHSALGTLNTYGEKSVLEFLNGAVQWRNITGTCMNSLGQVESFLKEISTLPEQRNFYHSSFGSGDANQFTSRDQDRWVYRAYECLKSAGETTLSASAHPMHFCYAYSNKQLGPTAYGICIPSSCADQHEQLLSAWQNYSSSQQDATILDYHGCTRSRHERQWYQQAIPLLNFVNDISLYSFVALATLFDYKRGDTVKTSWAQFLLAFSARRNLATLARLPKDPQSTITCFFGMRFLSMVWTLVGHSFVFVQVFVENVDEFKDDLVNGFGNQWITNFTLSVDTFFVLSATLTAYSWFRTWQKNIKEEEPTWSSWGYWLRFYRHRIIRLWPAYLWTLMAVTMRFSVTHYHPLWPPSDPAIQCPKHWWENALFLNSLFDNRCMPWTWYIGTEFIFFLVAPIFLLSLRRMPKVGLVLSVTVITLSMALTGIIQHANNFPPTHLWWRQPAIFNPDFIHQHLIMYIKPYCRIGPYIIGLLLGYYLSGWQRPLAAGHTGNGCGRLQFQFAGWSLAVIGGFWSIFGLYPALQGWNWPVYHLVYGMLHRQVFALSVSWLIYACHTGIGGPVNRILSFRFLIPLSSLCYTVYLFHMIPVMLTYLMAPFPIQYTGKLVIFLHCLIQLAISYVYGVFCALFAELPALNIERILLAPSNRKTVSRKTPPSSDAQMQLKCTGV